jgi:hypothetical protein
LILDEPVFGSMIDYSRIATDCECRPKSNSAGLFSSVAEDKFVQLAQTPENQISEKHEISEIPLIRVSRRPKNPKADLNMESTDNKPKNITKHILKGSWARDPACAARFR